MMPRNERRDRFQIRCLGRELAAIGIVESRADYVERWLGGERGQGLEEVEITDRLFLSLQFGLMLAKLELEDDLVTHRGSDENWMLRAKHMALNRIDKSYSGWLGTRAVFGSDLEL